MMPIDEPFFFKSLYELDYKFKVDLIGVTTKYGYFKFRDPSPTKDDMVECLIFFRACKMFEFWKKENQSET